MDIRVLPKIDTPGLNRLQRAMNNPTSEQVITGMLNQWGARMEAFTKRRFTLFSRGGGDWPPLAAITVDQRRGTGGKTIGQNRRAAKKAFGRLEDQVLERRQKLQAKLDQALRSRSADSKKVDSLRKRLINVQASVLQDKLTATVGRRNNALARVIKANNFKTSILVDTGTLRRGLALQGPGNVREVFANGRFIGVRYGVAGGSHPGKLTVGRLAAIHQRGSGRLPQRKIIVRPDAQTIAGMRLDAVRAMKRIRGGA